MPVDPQASSPVLSNHSHWTPFADQPPHPALAKTPGLPADGGSVSGNSQTSWERPGKG